MQKEEVNLFLNRHVAVLVSNRNSPGKTFAYFGTITKVTEDSIILEKDYSSDLTLLRLDQILEIHTKEVRK